MSNIHGKAVMLGSGEQLKFSYTGTFKKRTDGVVEFLSNGVLTVEKTVKVDAFLVGGGASGNSSHNGTLDTARGAAGGCGGYTKTVRNIRLTAGTPYNIVVGAGGAVQSTGEYLAGNAGGDTSAFGYMAKGGWIDPSTKYTNGGAGGSGGGAGGRDAQYIAGNGGSDGDNGGINWTSYAAGAGQGTTTREFGETTGKLYAGGGGGGNHNGAVSASTGGEGGGGNGGNSSTSAMPTSGEANTGGGGGGGCPQSGSYYYGAAGGSGIVCIRLAV